MAKVINKTITTHLTNMKDGDVAEIVNWFCDEEMEPGTIVQRCFNYHWWAQRSKLFTVEDTRRLLTCKVTILPPGSTIML